jgi:hypothetical protein
MRALVNPILTVEASLKTITQRFLRMLCCVAHKWKRCRSPSWLFPPSAAINLHSERDCLFQLWLANRREGLRRIFEG